MDVMTILGLISQGLQLLPTLVKAGVDITKEIQMLKGLSDGAQDGTVTDDQVQEVQDHLDELMSNFNAPRPDEGTEPTTTTTT